MIAGQLGGQKLEGDLTVQTGVFGEVHLTHAALAELVGDLVVGDRFADQWPLPKLLEGFSLGPRYGNGQDQAGFSYVRCFKGFRESVEAAKSQFVFADYPGSE